MPSKIYETLYRWEQEAQDGLFPNTIQVPISLLSSFMLTWETGTTAQTIEAVDELKEWLGYYLNVNPQEKSDLQHTAQVPPDTETAPRRLAYRDSWDRMEPTLKRYLTTQVLARDGFACRHCHTADNLTVDHITPLIKGGTNDLDNLQTLCRSCNSRKGDR